MSKIIKYPKNKENESSPGYANGITNLNSSEKNEELVTRNQIPGTPFTCVGSNAKWWVVMGKYRLTEQHTTEKEAILDGTTITWDRLLQVMQALIEMNNDEYENLKREKEIKHELENI